MPQAAVVTRYAQSALFDFDPEDPAVVT